MLAIVMRKMGTDFSRNESKNLCVSYWLFVLTMGFHVWSDIYLGFRDPEHMVPYWTTVFILSFQALLSLLPVVFWIWMHHKQFYANFQVLEQV